MSRLTSPLRSEGSEPGKGLGGQRWAGVCGGRSQHGDRRPSCRRTPTSRPPPPTICFPKKSQRWRGGSGWGCCLLPPDPLPGWGPDGVPESHTEPSNTSSAFPHGWVPPSPCGSPPSRGPCSLAWGARRGPAGSPLYPPGEALPASFGEGSEFTLRCHLLMEVSRRVNLGSQFWVLGLSVLDQDCCPQVGSGRRS